MSGSTSASAAAAAAASTHQHDPTESIRTRDMAAAIETKTVNPHNPEFITKRPWYLGGDGDGGAADAGISLDHQADQRLDKDKIELSLASADKALREEREAIKRAHKKQEYQAGMWVEALRNNKQPYRICKVTNVSNKGKSFLLDLEYEDGAVERKVKVPKKNPQKARSLFADKPRVRMTKTGARSHQLDAAVYGKETYDSKRDRYHGYDHASHTKKVEGIFQERAAIRKAIREKEKEEKEKERLKGKLSDGVRDENKAASDVDSDDSDVDSDVGSSDGEDSDDEFVQRDEDAKVITSRLARQGGVGGAQMKVTARNLRIREDTAKYLRNLDLDSAYYDPKSRSMRDNPNPELGAEESPFVGDNFTRISGDAIQLADTQLFAWNATERGVGEIHPQANPSQAELLKKTFQTKAATIQRQRQKAVLDKYGGSEYLDGSGGLAKAAKEDEEFLIKRAKSGKSLSAAEERKIRFGVSTVAEEYSRDGRLVKGQKGGRLQQTGPVKSKYEEDVFINGHTTVWGSYFHIGAFHWGYADDHSLTRNSYCTGENGRKANDEANEMRYGTGVAGSAALAQARGMLRALPKAGNPTASANQPPSMAMSKLYGEADVSSSVDNSELHEAMKRAEAREKEQKGDRKRKYNSMHAEVDVTEADMEAYRLRKDRGDDPMSNVGNDELLDYK